MAVQALEGQAAAARAMAQEAAASLRTTAFVSRMGIELGPDVLQGFRLVLVKLGSGPLTQLGQKTRSSLPIAYAACTIKEHKQMPSAKRDKQMTATLMEFAIPHFILLLKQAARELDLPYPCDVEKKLYLTTLGTGTGKAKPYAEMPKTAWVLGALQVLGRGNCFADVASFSLMSRSTAEKSFHRFCDCFSAGLWHQWVRLPEGDDLKNVESIYSRLGFPGAVGSTDCTHVAWERCPFSQTNNHKGKEGYTSVAFEVTCDHTGRIIASTKGYPGAENDKTIIKRDLSVRRIRDNDPWASYKYELRDLEGNVTEHTRGWLIVDGGRDTRGRKTTKPSLSATCLCAGLGTTTPGRATRKREEDAWSSRLESVRKDIECVFGRIKGRFRIFKTALLFSTREKVDNAWFTACIIHNMLLQFDGLGKLEEDMDWVGKDGIADGKTGRLLRRLEGTLSLFTRVRALDPSGDPTAIASGLASVPGSGVRSLASVSANLVASADSCHTDSRSLSSMSFELRPEGKSLSFCGPLSKGTQWRPVMSCVDPGKTGLTISTKELSSLPLWVLSESGDAIIRSFVAKDFVAAMAFMSEVARISEEQGHHPDLHLTQYRHVEILLQTHQMGGVTQNDIIEARLFDRLPVAYSPKWLKEHPEAAAPPVAS
eukprot:jgi/Undpi1/13766/HiC_scaffold_9.g03417.m1